MIYEKEAGIMNKFDVAQYAPGQVYELSELKNNFDQPYATNLNEGTFMVISSVRANSKLGSVIVAPIVEGAEDENPYGTQFMIRRGGTTVTHTVCVDRMFKAMKKRLCRYRYTVSEEVLSEVREKLSIMMFGEPLMTKTQAMAELYKEEMMLRAESIHKSTQNVSQQEIPVDNDPDVIHDFKPLSRAEEEARFAREQLEGAVSEIASVQIKKEKPAPKATPKQYLVIQTKTPDAEKENNAAPKKKPVKKSEQKVRTVINTKWARIYNDWQNFLPDYTTLSKEELMDKYNIPNVGTLYMLGKNCKRIAEEEGIDTKEFARTGK